MTVAKVYSPAGATIEAFHASDAFVRMLRGPIGSSKSSVSECILLPGYGPLAAEPLDFFHELVRGLDPRLAEVGVHLQWLRMTAQLELDCDRLGLTFHQPIGAVGLQSTEALLASASRPPDDQLLDPPTPTRFDEEEWEW